MPATLIVQHRLQTTLHTAIQRVRRTHWVFDALLWTIAAGLFAGFLLAQANPPTNTTSRPITNPNQAHRVQHAKVISTHTTTTTTATPMPPGKIMQWVQTSENPAELAQALGEQLQQWLQPYPAEMGQCSVERIRVGSPPKKRQKDQQHNTPKTQWQARCMAIQHHSIDTPQLAKQNAQVIPKTSLNTPIPFVALAGLLNPSDPTAWWLQGQTHETQGSVLKPSVDSLANPNDIEHAETKPEGWMETTQGRMTYQPPNPNTNNLGAWELQLTSKNPSRGKP